MTCAHEWVDRFFAYGQKAKWRRCQLCDVLECEVERAWATPVPPLVHGEIRDAGYSEFMCSDSFAVELMAGGMTHINGQPVTLHIVDELPGIGAVTMRWQPASCTAEDLLAPELEQAA